MKIHHSYDYVIATIGVDTAEKGLSKVLRTWNISFPPGIQFSPSGSVPVFLLPSSSSSRDCSEVPTTKKKEERAEAAGVEIDLVGEIIPAHHMKLPWIRN